MSYVSNLYGSGSVYDLVKLAAVLEKEFGPYPTQDPTQAFRNRPLEDVEREEKRVKGIRERMDVDAVYEDIKANREQYELKYGRDLVNRVEILARRLHFTYANLAMIRIDKLRGSKK